MCRHTHTTRHTHVHPPFKQRAVLLDYLQGDPQAFPLSASLLISPRLESPDHPTTSPLSAERWHCRWARWARWARWVSVQLGFSSAVCLAEDTLVLSVLSGRNCQRPQCDVNGRRTAGQYNVMWCVCVCASPCMNLYHLCVCVCGCLHLYEHTVDVPMKSLSVYTYNIIYICVCVYIQIHIYIKYVIFLNIY